jgi:hypothetical protein
MKHYHEKLWLLYFRLLSTMAQSSLMKCGLPFVLSTAKFSNKTFPKRYPHSFLFPPPIIYSISILTVHQIYHLQTQPRATISQSSTSLAPPTTNLAHSAPPTPYVTSTPPAVSPLSQSIPQISIDGTLITDTDAPVTSTRT